MRKTNVTLFVMVLFVFVLSGCGGYHNLGKTSDVLDSEAKKFEPIPEKSKLYIVRPSRFGGVGIYISPIVDRMVKGNLLSGSYLMLELLPGGHEISAAGNINDPPVVTIDAKAGQLYFVEMHPTMGVMIPGLHNELIDPDQGIELVRDCVRYKAVPGEPVSTPEEGVTLYIIRPSKLYAVAARLSPTVDNQVPGTLKSGSYLITKIFPGSHILSAAGKFEKTHTLEFQAHEGTDCFVTIEPKMGMALPQIGLKMITGQEAMPLIQKLEQIPVAH